MSHYLLRRQQTTDGQTGLPAATSGHGACPREQLLGVWTWGPVPVRAQKERGFSPTLTVPTALARALQQRGQPVQVGAECRPRPQSTLRTRRALPFQAP